MEEPSPISIEQIPEADCEKTPASVKHLVNVSWLERLIKTITPTTQNITMNDSLDATHLNLTEAHPDLIDTLKQLANWKPVILHHKGEQVAAVISIEDLHLFERLVEEEEDRVDIADIQKILIETKEEDWIPLERVQADLGL